MLSRSPPPYDIKPEQVPVALDGREGDSVTRDRGGAARGARARETAEQVQT